jgi:hypothetical protein
LPQSALDAINRPFDSEEVLQKLKRGKTRKSVVGPGKPILAQPVAKSIVPTVTSLCNAFVRNAALPFSAAVSALTPIRGNPTASGDYRGMAVGTLLSMIYASVLDGRIQWAAETHGQRASGQLGFRQDRSFAQAIFVLTTLMKVRRRWGGSMHVCYVDFQKAYDSVNRELLWKKMRGMGYGG